MGVHFGSTGNAAPRARSRAPHDVSSLDAAFGVALSGALFSGLGHQQDLTPLAAIFMGDRPLTEHPGLAQTGETRPRPRPEGEARPR
jgi:hypothetical protein